LGCGAGYPVSVLANLQPSFTDGRTLSCEVFVCQTIAVIIYAVTCICWHWTAGVANIALGLVYSSITIVVDEVTAFFARVLGSTVLHVTINTNTNAAAAF